MLVSSFVFTADFGVAVFGRAVFEVLGDGPEMPVVAFEFLRGVTLRGVVFEEPGRLGVVFGVLMTGGADARPQEVIVSEELTEALSIS